MRLNLQQDTQQYLSRKGTAENPPSHADFITGAVGGNVPEIIPVKLLSFIHMSKHTCDVDYSDRIDTVDEIESSHLEIKAADKEALSISKELATKRQKALNLALNKDKSLL